MNSIPSNQQESMALTWNQAAKDVRNFLSSDRIVYYRVLTEVITQIRSSLDLNTILKTTVEQVRCILNTDRVAIFQFNPELDWHGEVTCEDIQSPWKSARSIQVYDDCFGHQFASEYLKGRISAITDIYDPQVSECHRQILAQFQVRANLVAPLVKGNQLWGLLCIHQCSAPREWNTTEIEFVSQISAQLSVAIRQSELLQTAQRQADELGYILEQLKQTQAQMIQSEKMVSLGHLVAGVAHEINNPVSFVAGNLTYAEQYAQDLFSILDVYQQAYPDPLPQVLDSLEKNDLEFIQEDLYNILASMKSGTQRIQSIVSSLRSFSRLDEAQTKEVDIHEGIESTLMILNHRLQGNGDRPTIQVVKNYGDLPLIHCYPAQLNQVFMNLIGNGIDALEEAKVKEPQLEIETRINGEMVTILIRDNGPGIPKSICPKIFDPFFTTKPPGKGTGLGLSISYQIIVKKHHGTLVCESSPGNGTTFKIELERELEINS